MTLRYYAYQLVPLAQRASGSAASPERFGLCAPVDGPMTLDTLGVWPETGQAVLVKALSDDSSDELDLRALQWIDMAPAGPRLELLYRGLRVLWKSGRAYVQGPEALLEPALDAVLDYALLVHQLAHLEQRADALGVALLSAQRRAERGRDVAPLRAQLAEATELALRVVDLRPFCEVPARTGQAGPAMRVRTELLTQAQTADALGLIEHRLEIVTEGLENRLQRAQEALRARLEAGIGVLIILLLIIDLVWR